MAFGQKRWKKKKKGIKWTQPEIIRNFPWGPVQRSIDLSKPQLLAGQGQF